MRTIAAILMLSAAVLVAAEDAEAPRQPKKVKAEADDEATLRIKEVLKGKRVSFDFVDTPVGDALAFVQQLVDVNVVVSPAVERDRRLSLKVNNMEVGKALHWMLKLVGARMSIKDGAIYVDQEKGKDGRNEDARVAKVMALRNAKRHKRMIGRAQLNLGSIGSVELYLYEDDLEPETREMLVRLLYRALAAEVGKLGREEAAGEQ